jgi:RNA polymerase sigma-70 factor (ECF subfamily)
MDDTLIERARAGDAAAMEALITEVAPSAERFARRLCPGADVDDVLQETLLSLVTHLDRFEGRSALKSWVFAITRSACSHQRRGLKNRPHEGDDAVAEVPDAAPDPEQRAAGDELSRSLTRALDSLSPEHREVILLRDMEGLTAPEAAASLGLSVDALKSRLHRARAALRDALRPALEASAPPPTPRCPDVMALWSKRLEGDLSPDDCAEMERHMEGCPSCGAACDALKSTLWACQSVRAPKVTPEMRAQIRRAMEAWRSASV